MSCGKSRCGERSIVENCDAVKLMGAVYTTVMKRKEVMKGIFDYTSIVVSFLIFFFAWFNGNLTDMPWYGLLLVIALTITAALGFFAILEIRNHKRLAIAFGVLLLLMSVPSMAHRALGFSSGFEAAVFYLKQVYIPLLAGSVLFLLLKKQQKTWQALLRWGTRLYAAFGITLGVVVLYMNFTQNTPIETAGIPDEIATALTIAMIIGIILTIIGLLINPLYVLWRNETQNTGR